MTSYSTSKSLYLTRVFLRLEAAAWMFAIQFGLRICGFRAVNRILPKIVPPEQAAKGSGIPASGDQIIRAVHSVSRFFPTRGCLRTALVVRTMFARRHCFVKLQIGLTARDGKVAAHAWVEKNGRVLIGGEDSPHRYIPVTGHTLLADRLFSQSR